jgi:HNH endonuclease
MMPRSAAIATSSSFVAALTKLGVDPANGLGEKLRRRVRRLAISTRHFAASASGKGVKTRWTDDQLQEAVATSTSVAQVIRAIGLIPAGGNYDQVQRRIAKLGLNTSHFKGSAWSAGLSVSCRPATPLAEVLVAGRPVTSHQLKQRLFREGLKKPACELCGWADVASDGRIPVELDHVNGDKTDNRLENLRILCPNCHSLQPTHRGLNTKWRRR